ncbi:MAG TPA: RNA 2',3'-cyclic phosphodiesterase [Burkholderiales bacterium]|nr:RNA 2',3'-cyclic phosphodiesterase [Burkholderiales bacterium]
MRLFFALWPNAVTRTRLDRWGQSLHDVCGGRRTSAESLHLTLAFLGNVADARVPEVEAAMQRVAPRRFLLTLDTPGYWKKNSIAWAGTTAVPAELEALAADLRTELAAAGIPFDPQPFAVHVTLLRDARAPAAMPALEAIAWPVDGFALVASAGGRYEIRKASGPGE